uniref:beta strand repeat-containing protein n=1 Tax=Algoriphagus sp. TaxID=1872435 RepID=UPI00404708BF
MKKLVTILFLTLGIASFKSYAQVPGITYQAVILSPDGKALPGINHANTPLAEQEICLKFSFLNLAGDYEYEEIIQTKTDPFGMVNVIIGKGEQVGGLAASFDKIPWSIAAKFLEVSLDKSGACGEFSLISKQEFTAVPFALFSVNSGTTDSESTQGKSAYQVWIDLGNVGSEQDFINSLKGPIGATGPAGTIGPAGVSGAAGPQGPTGSTGITGTTGPAGTTGSNGLSAYQVWLGLGNTGTENNFIASLTGPTGPQGPAGVAGATGTTGNRGATGVAGTNGLSAYQVWLGLGNTGTEANFIASLTGPTGPQGPAGATGPAGADGAAASAATFVDLSTNQTIGGTKTFTNPIAGSVTGSAGSTSGNAATATLATTATALATPRNINGVAFDGSADISIGIDANSISGVVPVLNGGTGQTTLSGIKTILGLSSNSVAIGNEAGLTNQGLYSIAIGSGAGRNGQGIGAIGIGSVSGDVNQAVNGIAIGNNTAQANQASEAIAIGYAAGQNSQGSNAVALGAFAGNNNQVANSIAINATGSSTPLNPANAGFYVNPIRSAAATADLLYYDAATKEVISASGGFVDLTTNQSIGGTKTFTSPITGSVTGNATTVTTNANLSGDVTSLGNVTTLSNSAVIGQVLTGYAAGAGTVAATDNILQAIQKVDGNINAAISSVASGKQNTLTNSAGLLGALNDETGTGLAVFSSSPTLATPDLGTPSAVVLTNATGLPLPSGVSGTLTVANGGTGATSLTGYMKGNGTSTMTASASIPVADVTGAATQTALNLKANIASPTFTGSLNVDGAASNFQTKVYSTSDTTLDFALSNLITTNASAGVFNLENMKDGGTYTLAVTGGVSGTASFSQSGLSFSSLHNVSTTSGKTALYTFIVMGTQVYFSMTSVE